MKACPEAEGGLSLFQLARLRIQGWLPDFFHFIINHFVECPHDPRRMAVNICGGHSIPPSSDQVSRSYLSHRLLDGAGGGSCSGLHIITLLGFRDFFTWLFQPGKEQLEVFAAIAIPTIQGLVSLLVWSFLIMTFKRGGLI